jgi:hypothetical protein
MASLFLLALGRSGDSQYGSYTHTIHSIWGVETFVVREDLTPRYDLFCAEEHITTWLATDALAERVLRAGCTGLAFYVPETAHRLPTTRRRIKTLEGVAEYHWTAEAVS